MKLVTFTFAALVEDDLPQADIDDIALCAFVQIQEPESAPSPSWVRHTVKVQPNYNPQEETRMDYDQRSQSATTRQGLDPVVNTLTGAGITHAVEQTGGFTMVVTVTVPGGTCAITYEGDDGYLLGFYPGNSWVSGAEDATYSTHALSDLVGQIQQRQQ